MFMSGTSVQAHRKKLHGVRQTEEAQREEEEALTVEVGAVEEERGELERRIAAQRIAKAWYACERGHYVRYVRWASAITSEQPSTDLKSALTNDGARLRLLEKLWGSLGNTAAIAAGDADIPGAKKVRDALKSAGYPEPSKEELLEVSKALKNDLGRLKWDFNTQLQARRGKLSYAALSSGHGSLDSSSSSLMVPRSPPMPTSLLKSSAAVTPAKTPEAARLGSARALTASRAANRLSVGEFGVRSGGAPSSASIATVYASIVPALNQLKARGEGSIALRAAGAKALAQAALDPQTREAIVRADGARLLRAAIAKEQQGSQSPRALATRTRGDLSAEVAPAVGLLRLEVDIALERLGQAADG